MKRNLFNGDKRKLVETVEKAINIYIDSFFAKDYSKYAENGGNLLMQFKRRLHTINDLIEYNCDDKELKKQLLEITHVFYLMTCTCSYPAGPAEWRSVNPNLRFYLADFEAAINAPEGFEKIKTGKTVVKECEQITDADLAEYFEYFAGLYRKSANSGFGYSKFDFYRFEIRETIRRIFEKIIVGLY